MDPQVVSPLFRAATGRLMACLSLGGLATFGRCRSAPFFLLRCNHVLRLKLHIFIHLSTYLSIYLPTYRSVYLSVYLSIYVLFHVCIEDRLAICSWIFTIRNEMEYKWMIYWIEIERGPSFFFGFAMGGFSS